MEYNQNIYFKVQPNRKFVKVKSPHGRKALYFVALPKGQNNVARSYFVKLQVQGPNLELTLLSHSNKNSNNNNKNNKNNKNPHLNFIRKSHLVGGIKATMAMAEFWINFKK